MQNRARCIVTLFVFCSFLSIAMAQVGINTDNSAPASSAMLDISSSDKGILIPRMDSTSRAAILQPADGLMVYDTTTTTFWYYDEERWNEIRNGSTKLTPTDFLDSIPEPDFSCLEVVGSVGVGNVPRDLAVSGNFAYVINDIASGDLKVIDLSDPNAPSVRSTVGVGSDPASLAFSDGLVYIVDESSGDLRIIDVRDPDNLTLRSTLAVGRRLWSVAVRGNLAYLLDQRDYLLYIIDVSDPDNPIERSFFSLVFSDSVDPNFVDIAVAGNYAYAIAGRDNVLRVIDVSDPDNPALSGSLAFSAEPVAVEISGDNAYVASVGTDGLQVIDVSDPTIPTLSGSLALPNTVTALTITRNYALVVGGNSFHVVNVSDSSAPSLVISRGGLVGTPIAISVQREYAYVTNNQSNNLRVIDLACSENDLLGFNPLNGKFQSSRRIADNLGDHMATTNLNLANFNLINGGSLNSNTIVGNTINGNTINGNTIDGNTIDGNTVRGNTINGNSVRGNTIWGNSFSDDDGVLNTNRAAIGGINVGNQSTDQGTSNQAGNGFTTTPWVYTNAVEAQGERNANSTLITIGNDGTYGTNNEIHLVTNGESRMVVNADGSINLNGGALTTGDISAGDISAGDISAVAGNLTNLNSAIGKIGSINRGTESTDQGTSNQASNGFTTTPWVYTNAIEAQGERGDASTLITIGNDGTYGTNDEIHLVTNGESRMKITANGSINLNGGALTAGDISTSEIIATTGLLTNLSSAVGNIGIISQGTQSYTQNNSGQSDKGFMVTPWLYSSALQAPAERGQNASLITVGNGNGFGADNEIHLVTNGNPRLRITADGRVGISRNPTTQKLEVNGNASKVTAGDWLANSDARLKKNIQQLNAETILEKLLSLKGITYEWDDDRTSYERPVGIQYGFTAQNIQEVFPTLVEEDADGYLQTAYGTYDAMYVEAFRAQQRQIDVLRAENQQLQQQVARIQEVEAMLASLQQQLSTLGHSFTNDK